MPKLPESLLKKRALAQPQTSTEPFWTTSDGETVQLWQGNVIDVLRKLPEKSVQCVITSPPYWGLRDYGVDQQIGSERSPDCLGWARKENCAARDWSNGCHVCRMVLVFREVRRVLRDDGTCWLNYGDSYASGGKYSESRNDTPMNSRNDDNAYRRRRTQNVKDISVQTGLPSGNLVGVPWRVALALQSDGWILRQDIIWAKPSPMPESVRNRCTKSHEYVFLLAKQQRYYYDAEAVKEKNASGTVERYKDNPSRPGSHRNNRYDGTKGNIGFQDAPLNGSNKRSVWEADDYLSLLHWMQENYPTQVAEYVKTLKNKRDVWRIASEAYAGAHFATFPSKLITPMILAGTSAHGCCAECGAPWKRVVETEQLKRERPNEWTKYSGEEGTGNSCPNTVAGVSTKTVGWEPSCECFLDENRRCRNCHTSWGVEVPLPVGKDWNAKKRVEGKTLTQGQSARDREDDDNRLNKSTVTVSRDMPCECFLDSVIPCTVMDIFVGSGTTCCVALDKGRRSIGIDLSESYLRKNAIPRIEGELLSRPALAYLVRRSRERLDGVGEEV